MTGESLQILGNSTTQPLIFFSGINGGQRAVALSALRRLKTRHMVKIAHGRKRSVVRDSERRRLSREIVWHQRQTNRLLAVIVSRETQRERKGGGMTKRMTKIMMLIVLVLVIIWDVAVAVNSVPGDTISEITLATAYRHPVVPFAIGIVCGHLFWPQQKRKGIL